MAPYHPPKITSEEKAARLEEGMTSILPGRKILNREDYGIQVFPIVTVREVIDFLHNNPVDGKVYIDDEMKAKMEAYLAEYGAR